MVLTVWLAAKEKTPTLALGNNLAAVLVMRTAKIASTRSALKGFTLLELIVVVSIIAAASAGVTLAMRDSSQTLLDRDAQRLAVLLEAARAQSRATGVVVRWQPTPAGFVFEGIAQGVLPTNWLSQTTRPTRSVTLLLGPESMIGPQFVDLTDASQSGNAQAITLRLATDGLRPFKIEPLSPQINSPS